MSPEHKAQKLFFKFRHQNLSTWINDADAIKCTIILVDEIIDIQERQLQGRWIEYWKKVKKEIEKIKKEIENK